MSADLVTGWARAALSFLMVQHPTRTSLGLAGGILAATIIDMCKPFLSGVNTAALTDFRLAVAGVFVSNVSLLVRKEALPEAIEQEFVAIRRAVREGKLSAAHEKMLYLKAVQTVLDHVVISKTPAVDEGEPEDAPNSSSQRRRIIRGTRAAPK